MGVRPEGVKADWDECNVWTQAFIIAYNQIREIEEFEELEASIGATTGAKAGV